jgi:hypothetical protein
MNEQLSFEMVSGPLKRTCESYLKEINEDSRKNLLHNIGNLTLLTFHENNEMFEEYIKWVRETREIIQKKAQQNET